jgi:hypothetical protein
MKATLALVMGFFPGLRRGQELGGESARLGQSVRARQSFFDGIDLTISIPDAAPG